MRCGFGELIAEHTDIPPGVVNIVTSNDHAVGALLSSDPRVDMVSFTGSTNTGRAVMAAGAATIKKVFLELGGKSAGGGWPADREKGFFIQPTVIAGLDNSARWAREKIFGPVLTVIAHDGDDDAIRIAERFAVRVVRHGVQRRPRACAGRGRPHAGWHRW